MRCASRPAWRVISPADAPAFDHVAQAGRHGVVQGRRHRGEPRLLADGGGLGVRTGLGGTAPAEAIERRPPALRRPRASC